MQEDTPRQLPERTGRHLCVRCLREVAIEEFLRNDHFCDACAADEENSGAGPGLEDDEPAAEKNSEG